MAARRGGFTLVELLAVIGVVSLLVGVLLPALSRARLTAQDKQCLNNLRSFGQSLTMYVSDWGWYFPRSSHTTGSTLSGQDWLLCLQEYGVIPQSRVCPSDPDGARKTSSYATNDYLEPLTAGIDYNPINGRTLPGGRTRAIVRVIDVPRPFATIYAVEVGGAASIDHIHAVGWTRSAEVAGVIAVERHFDHANYLFCDGRAAPIAWDGFAASFNVSANPFNPLTAR